MSQSQKQLKNIKCPICKKTRRVSLSLIQAIRRGETSGKCRHCAYKGRKMSDQAKKNMSLSKRKLVASGWLPEFTRKNKGKISLKLTKCLFCSKDFKQKTHQFKQCCSYSCANRLRVKNATHHWWKGGVCSINLVIRGMSEYKQWRQEIIQRDGYKCKDCGVESTPNRFVLMEVDHIQPLSFLLKTYSVSSREEAEKCTYLWDIDNGRVLCESCHKKTDTYAGKALTYQELITN